MVYINAQSDLTVDYIKISHQLPDFGIVSFFLNLVLFCNYSKRSLAPKVTEIKIA